MSVTDVTDYLVLLETFARTKDYNIIIYCVLRTFVNRNNKEVGTSVTSVTKSPSHPENLVFTRVFRVTDHVTDVPFHL